MYTKFIKDFLTEEECSTIIKAGLETDIKRLSSVKRIGDSYIKLRNSELKEFKQKENFDKAKPITSWERNNTLDC